MDIILVLLYYYYYYNYYQWENILIIYGFLHDSSNVRDKVYQEYF